MKIKVMYRTQCLAAYLGYGPDFDVENIGEPTLIISISSTDDQIPLKERGKQDGCSRRVSDV